MDMTAKRKKERLTDEASKLRFVCKPFLSSDFPSVACFRCRMPYKRMVGRGKVFGQNTLRRRKILPETVLPPDLASAIKPCATFASGHRKQVSGGMELITPSVASSATGNKQRDLTSIQFTNYKLPEQHTVLTAYPKCNGYNHFKVINVITDSIGLSDILHRDHLVQFPVLIDVVNRLTDITREHSEQVCYLKLCHPYGCSGHTHHTAFTDHNDTSFHTHPITLAIMFFTLFISRRMEESSTRA